MKDATFSAFAGIQNTVPPERVRSAITRDNARIDLVEAVNVDIDETGRVSRRAGMTMQVPGAAHSLWANDDVCFYIADGVMYRLHDDFASEPVAGGLGASRMNYVQVNDRIYHSNGRSTAVYDAGRVRSWGMPLALGNVSASVTTGVMPAGVYQFALTMVRSDGQESGCGIAHRLDLPAGAGVAFAWDVPDDMDIIDVNLYLTQPDSETLLLAATVDVEAGGYTYAGGQRAVPLATQWLDAPPAGTALAVFKGRIYIASDEFIFATAPLSYEHCDLRDFRAIDGTAIRFLGAVEGGLFVGTDKGIYFAAGAIFAEGTLVKKLDATAVAGSLVLADGGDVTGRSELTGIVVALFATSEGIVMGMPDGSLSNFTQERFVMPPAVEGAAIFRSATIPQYLLST